MFEEILEDFKGAVAIHSITVNIARRTCKGLSDEAAVSMLIVLNGVQEKLGKMMNELDFIIKRNTQAGHPIEVWKKISEAVIALYFTNSEIMEFGEIM